MLTYITDRSLDDFFYFMLSTKPDKLKEFEDLNISEGFLERVYEFYQAMGREELQFVSSQSTSGYSTGLALLVTFFGLRYQDITIITLPNPKYKSNMLKLIRGFLKIVGATPEVDVQMVKTDSTNQYISITNSETNNVCEIRFLSSGTYKSADLKGLIFSDNAGPLRNENIQKLEGLIETMDETPRPHDKIILNFPTTEVYNNLVETYSKTIRVIKFI